MAGLLYERESFGIRGAIFEVYREMGSGFVESVYQECLERELSHRGIPFAAQPELRLSYKKAPLRQTYRPDIVCHDKIILELKAVSALGDEHRAQVMNYLRAASMRLAFLVNFGRHHGVEIERIVL
ncbi:MAG: GxxExxY protein [Candidatus Hydrogenedentota bacterium]